MSQIDKNHDSNQLTDWDKEESRKKLSKRLAYLLRYGAVKEGLEVDDNGYVELGQLCRTNLLQRHSEAEVLEAIKTSTSYRHTNRYDYRERDGQVYVRAAYLRNFEKVSFVNEALPVFLDSTEPISQEHKSEDILFEFSMGCVLDYLDDFDLQDFPDEHILRLMLRRLKREKKLTTKALRVLLVPTITCLDLEGVYLTNSSVRLVWTQCPHLRAVSLKDCGYIITDNILAQFTKNLPCLERLNLCLCSHLTNKSLASLAKNLPRLHTLHMTRVPSLTAKGVLDFLQKSLAIKFLDVYYLQTTSEEYKSLVTLAQTREVTLVLREPWETMSTSMGKVEEDETSREVNDAQNDSVENYRDVENPVVLERLLNEMWIDNDDEM
ncbi:F-box protein SKP2B-like [Elysia marginata]|uniref:2'-phosphotransferase n=1 Tax=Elysia marginata TaxID=1093978 RepID=A0AAV4JGZ1_9GAST|nr:F-box protein SKP2B-like [Elysia marginata]